MMMQQNAQTTVGFWSSHEQSLHNPGKVRFADYPPGTSCLESSFAFHIRPHAAELSELRSFVAQRDHRVHSRGPARRRERGE